MINFLATKACSETFYPKGPSKFRVGRWNSRSHLKADLTSPFQLLVDWMYGAILTCGIEQARLATTHKTITAGAANRPTEFEPLPLLGRAPEAAFQKWMPPPILLARTTGTLASKVASP